MASCNSKLNEELTPLTAEAASAAVELSAPNTLSHIISPQTPRWLSLTSFKSVPIQYKWESELEAEVEEAIVFSDDESESLSHSTKIEERGRSRKRAWSSESVEVSPFEKASSRALAVLRCYFYNLEHGMLVTGKKVDERVEGALLRLLGKVEVGGTCGMEMSKQGDMRESWEVSDEERVVVEIDAYGKELKRLREDVPEDVKDVVKDILKWTRVKGTVNNREDMTSSRESFEFIEC
ncbi:hypothetical protein L207DRAFT_532423 [Hyaloscypha variabilis F]|uniref:Uncharacterized protein n=1 Tax=Hyaloscypha variabilis (strain UAMH 11265 / GT02V1 / F) TaxID=1149755 RepID=A0A2J6REA8_HYAVF|nr:hypothetical protein L207DRAFT_532423 [Hyaloscypha variabilis F]